MNRFLAIFDFRSSIFCPRSSILYPLFSILVIGLGLGCSRNNSEADYETPDDTVQKALTAALTAWKDGKPPGAIEGASPPVQVVDSKWQNGDKLESFEILGEEDGPEGPSRVFSVKLTSPAGEVQTVRYVLVGKGHVWVYREEDFGRATGMEGGVYKKKRKK
jgi:hypothetical protein